LTDLVSECLRANDEVAARAVVAMKKRPEFGLRDWKIIAIEQKARGDRSAHLQSLEQVRQVIVTDHKPEDPANSIDWLVEAYFAAGEPNKAVDLVKSLPRHPQLGVRPGVNMVVREFAKAGDVDAARAFVLDQQPEWPGLAWVEIVRGSAATGRFDEARRTADGIGSGPSRDSAYASIVTELIKSNRLPEARDLIAKIANEKTQRRLVGEAATATAKAQSIDEVIAAERQATSREEILAILQVLFDKLVEAKRFDEAESKIQTMIDTVNNFPRPAERSAFGQWDDNAARTLLRAKALPLARAVHTAGDRDRAVRLLDSVEPEIIAMDDAMGFGKLLLIGEALVTRSELGMSQEAEKFINCLPEHIRSQFIDMLATLQAKAGNVDAALKTIEQYSQAERCDAGSLIAELARQKQIDALKKVITLLGDQPQHTDDYQQLGSAMLKADLASELDTMIAEFPSARIQAYACLGASRSIRNAP